MIKGVDELRFRKRFKRYAMLRFSWQRWIHLWKLGQQVGIKVPANGSYYSKTYYLAEQQMVKRAQLMPPKGKYEVYMGAELTAEDWSTMGGNTVVQMCNCGRLVKLDHEGFRSENDDVICTDCQLTELSIEDHRDNVTLPGEIVRCTYCGINVCYDSDTYPGYIHCSDCQSAAIKANCG